MIRYDHAPDGDILTAMPGRFNRRVDHVISRLDATGKLLGGVTYDNFCGTSICMHVCSFDPRWLSKDMLWVIFHYPFVHLGCKKVLGFVESTNKQAIAFEKKIGFIEEARIADACPGGDVLVMSMRREDCRWLNIRPTGVQWRGNPQG